MTHRRLLTLALSLALALAASGCLQPGAVPPAPAALQVAVPGSGTVTAVTRLAPTDPEGRRLLGAAEAWRKADIDHVQVELFEGNAPTSLASLSVARADLDGTLSFNGLKRSTAYRLVTKAWSDPGEWSPIDDGDADPASCTTAFETTTGDRIDAGPIKLKLSGAPFAGTTSAAGILVTDGQVIDMPQ